MFIVEAKTIIAAPPEIVWETLTNFKHYTEWSTMLHALSDAPQHGQKIKLRLTLPDGPDYAFSPTVTDLTPPRRFAWKAVTGIPGIFDGEHIFELNLLATDQTELINRERYSGLLTPIIKRTAMMRDAPQGFAAMNAEIKQRSESLFSQL